MLEQAREVTDSSDTIALPQDYDASVPASVYAALRRILPWLSFWIVMAACFGLTAWLTDERRLGEWGWYVMAQISVVLVFLFELIIPRDPAHGLLRDRQSWNDIGYMLLFKLVFRPLSWSLVFAFIIWVAPDENSLPHIWPSGLPVPLQFVLLLLIFDLMGYLYHRALHRFDRLYAFHAIHHDTRKMHVLKSNRLHFGESALNFMIMVPPMMLAGVPDSIMIWLGMWEVFEGNLSHSNVDQRFPRFFHYIVRTADVHRIHHSRDDAQQNSNFGGLPIWDLLFATYRHPSREQVADTGIAGDPVPTNWVRQLLFPFRALVNPALVGSDPARLDRVSQPGTSASRHTAF